MLASSASIERSTLSAPSLPSRNFPFPSIGIRILALCFCIASVCSIVTAQTAGVYQVTNIISDGSVPATTTDPTFIAPWGVSGGGTLWINAAGSGFNFVTSFAGAVHFKAVIPPASGTGAGIPTGTVLNTTASGFVLSNGSKASFLFSTYDGTISGWNGALLSSGNIALIAVNNNSKNAVYTDMALITNTNGSYLLVPNFGAGGNVEVYDTNFAPATLQGSFTDPNVPSGYAPYGVKTIGSQVFVTYMLRSTTTFAPNFGTNTGFVSVFDDNGTFIARAVTGGNLNAPWGVAMAPAGFGIYGGDLLIGNFGDGLITAYNPTSYAYLGTVSDLNGKPLIYTGLWDIFASTNAAADPNDIYFTAAIGGGSHGLFGAIGNSTTSTSTPTFNLSASSQVASIPSPGVSASLIVSIAPVNGFNGTVNLTCGGLPTGTTCIFAPPQLTPSGSAPVTTPVTIQTTGNAALSQPNRPGSLSPSLALGLLVPFGSVLVLLRRRSPGNKNWLRMLSLAGILLASIGLVTSCSSKLGSTVPPPSTPFGTTQFTITAASGSITQTMNVSLNVQ